MQTLTESEIDHVAGGMFALGVLVWELANVSNISDFTDGFLDRFLHERYPGYW